MRHFLCAAIAFIAASGAAPAMAQDGRWLRAETAGFVVYSTANEQRVQRIAEDLEAFDALLRRLTNAAPERSPTRVEIYLFNGPGQYQEAFPGASSSNRGRYAARADIIAAYAIFRDGYGIEAQDILFHEYAHHFMYQHFANVYPAWYVEGFAEFVATAAFESERIVLGRSTEARASWLFAGSWLPMERMIEGRPSDPEDVARFYAQSWLFTHYLFNTEGKMEQFRAYVRELRLGAAPSAAFQTGFGITPSAMQSELRTYLRRNPSALALTRPATVDRQQVNLARLPASADELLPLTTRVRRGWISDDDAPDLLSRIRRLAGSHHGDTFAVLALAEAEATLGETANARTLLTPLIAQQPNNTQAHYLMGRALLRDAQEANERGDIAARDSLRAEARPHFARAFRLDANHVPTLFRYAQSYADTPMDGTTHENALNALLLARQLAPQVSDITFMAADWLLAAGRPAEAIPMLRVIAYDPHGGQAADHAQEMLERAHAALASEG